MKKQKIPVSVIIPVYNRAAMLGRALQSVVRQSVQCEEVIVVDDGSTDGSRELVEDMLVGEPGMELRWLRSRPQPGACRRQKPGHRVMPAAR